MYKTSCLCGIMSRDNYLDLYMRLYGNRQCIIRYRSCQAKRPLVIYTCVTHHDKKKYAFANFHGKLAKLKNISRKMSLTASNS